ncbi:hypothetical protein IFM89_015535 [Coptis chinensis]|uniref:Uncharacterized protein n=1 Tax=Coptis chinensis TaxID=261450 RepID=A0A835J0I1_9MAGN|nr:hypothetical protein IFM89_015535 [Coptis chinensis]
MFHAIVEFISRVSSNSLLVFSFCNLIILILFVSHSKCSSSPSHNESGVRVALSPKETEKEHIEEDEASFSIQIEASSDIVAEVPVTKKELVNQAEANKNKDEEDEDELRRRSEEFIEKINRAWKAEKLGTSGYTQRE